MEIDIWKGEWGLPSIDVHCLQVLTYAKFSGAPIKINPTNNPLRTPHGALPVFKHDNEKLTKFSDISSHLRKFNHSADYELSPKQCAEVLAYSQLINEKLNPALKYVWWMDAKNFVEFSRPLYAKLLPFPTNFYYPGQYEKHAKQLLFSLYNEDEDPQVIETAVYKEAEECITLLATKLGEKDFFFGQTPCSLDAVVFAHLAPLFKAPLPSSALQNHLKACTNLTRFISRILQRYFAKDMQEADQKERQSIKPDNSNVDAEFPNKMRNYAITALFATVAMVAFAISAGIIELSIEEPASSEDDDDE